jgi:hypothetical protein
MRYEFNKVVENGFLVHGSGSCPQALAQRPVGDRKIRAGGILTAWLDCCQ